MTRKDLENYLQNKPNVRVDYPFGDQVAVYKVNTAPGEANEDSEKMFALLTEKDPMNLSLKCDPGLSKVLREKYESVMPGYHLNKKHWNTIIVSGQLDDQEIFDLVNLSYRLVAGIS